ncbi:MAG: alpha/beta hydrolase [Thiolinea sp.]
MIADVQQLATALHLQRFSVIGLSGGCPYALACAWGLPEQVERAIVMGGFGEFAVSDHADTLSAFARFSLRSAKRFPWLNQLFYGTVVAPLVRNNPQLLKRLQDKDACEPDRLIWEQPWVAESFHSLAAGSICQRWAGSGL